MFEHGARHFTYLGRSGASGAEAQAMLEYLKGKGVSTEVIKCDITVKSEVDAAVKQASKQREIKGVLNAAAVFEVSFLLLENDSKLTWPPGYYL